MKALSTSRLTILSGVFWLLGTSSITSSLRAGDRSEAEVKSPQARAAVELTPEAARVAKELRSSLEEGSEGRAMLDQILEGSRLGPGEGWFRLATSKTRFGWPFVEATYDRNSDGRVDAKEFSGARESFVRLDRNRDDALTQSDFDWSEHSLTRTPGFLLFFQADQDANGKLTRNEFAALFEMLDSDRQGFLALDDLRDEFQPATEEPGTSRPRPNGPSPSTLVLALKRQEIGSLQPGPVLNETAPDFTLPTLEGKPVTLSNEVGDRPIVLIFGNFTCGPFRSQSGNLEKLYSRYRDRAKFFLVYVREAHPSDGWRMTSNERAGINLAQPQSNADRRSVAAECRQHLALDIPFLVDTVEDEVGAMYSGMPNRLYLIDREGRIAFKNGRGPFGFHPRELEQALVLLLEQQGTR